MSDTRKIVACARQRDTCYVVRPAPRYFLGHWFIAAFGGLIRRGRRYWVLRQHRDPNDRGYDAIRRVFPERIIETPILAVKHMLVVDDSVWRGTAFPTPHG